MTEVRSASQKVVRFAWLTLVVCFWLVIAAFVLTLLLGSRACTVAHYTPVASAVPPPALSIPYQHHLEGNTYLLFPTWYTVLNAAQFTNFTKYSPANRFTYLTSIGQYWCSYESVASLTYRAGYPVDLESHLKILAIGALFTIENDARFLYEHTAGWITGYHLPPVRAWNNPERSGSAYITATDVTDSILAALPEVALVGKAPDGAAYLKVPFTSDAFLGTVKALAIRGVQIRDIEGNANIALSVVVPQTKTDFFPEVHEVLSMPIATEPGYKRILFSVAVPDLAVTITNFQAQKITIERLYTY